MRPILQSPGTEESTPARLTHTPNAVCTSVLLRLGLMWAAAEGTLPALGGSPSIPGDCNLDWWVDLAEYGDFERCLQGPAVAAGDLCHCHDQDEDGHVDLRDAAWFQAAFTGTQLLVVDLAGDPEDGTEVDDAVWHADGYGATGLNRMGRAGAHHYDIGLRFHLPQVAQGETFVYARLVLPGTGDGKVVSTAALRIVGIDQDGVAGFNTERPSQSPKTDAAVAWIIGANWPDPAEETYCHTPLLRHSPDIAPLINKIVQRPGWGSSPEGKTLGIVIEGDESSGNNFLTIEDFDHTACGGRPGPVAPRLELYRTLRSTFVGRELLGRPTDHSVTLNAVSLLTLEAFVEYGDIPNAYTSTTPLRNHPGGEPLEVVLEDLAADKAYYYRLCYRRPGDESFQAGPQRSFHTQRPAGSAFWFTIQSDSHQWEAIGRGMGLNRRNGSGSAAGEREQAVQGTDLELYRRALKHVAADGPDFHLALGDTVLCEDYSGRDVLDFQDAVVRHLAQRPCLDLVCHSAPFFLALGNHEGEQGWRLDGTADNVAVWATHARKLIYPLPAPDGFYSGHADPLPFVGLRENYYAWEWGDALFVVLDPFWYTAKKPHSAGGTAGTGDNWDWTLGFAQYDWLRNTLANSTATFKFVFAHHVTGGCDTYGRGGIEAARHALGGRGSFEWGGEDLSGEYTFDARRPCWGSPVHQLLVDHQVTIFFHGHDHAFVKQELDGVVYQECPRPDDSLYLPSLFEYLYGDPVNNSGHLRVNVSPVQVTVEYVRAYLPGDGADGTVAYSYTVE